MAKKPRTVAVASCDRLTPNMMALVLSGDSLADFPEGFEGGYIKLTLPQEDGSTKMRSFTVRRFDPARRKVEINLSLHGGAGPSAAWLRTVSEGTQITIQGPGACKRPLASADWFLLAGDMTALPAICVHLENLDASAQGNAVLEVRGPEDELELSHPEGIDIQWIHHADPVNASPLEAAVRAVPWREGRASAWIAGEYTAARALRQYLRHERQVDTEALYASCYWKIGASDEGMKAAKRADGAW